MKALVASGGPELVEIAEVPDPRPAPGEVVVEVRAVSVNRGELHRLITARPGWRPGWDFAGIIGYGPRRGERVFGIALGESWAERVAVPAGQLATIPGGIAMEEAAALPTAGLTALRALRLGGELGGRRVLVTGAAGGVGRFAVQLAHRAGAQVTAVVGRSGRMDSLEPLGADEISVGTAQLAGGYDLILESAGGDSLAEAMRLVAPGGTVVSFGNSARAPTLVNVSAFYPKQACLRGFYVLTDLVERPPGADLAHLVGLADAGELDLGLAATGTWDDVRQILRELRERRLPGKAVLRVRWT